MSGVCPRCGFNRWRTTGLRRVTRPTGKDRELITEVIEVEEPCPVCRTCEEAARRVGGRTLETARDQDPDAGSPNSPAGQLPHLY